ncbi:MAG: hypothetical protein LBR26_09445 [Prevotella sp.]|jgi:hypothetical protein|nr:hypothetical protein [Prevotella sp.]
MNGCSSNVKTVEGTQLKLNVSLCLPGNLTMDDVGFACFFYIYSNKTKRFEKEKMSRVDENNYTVLLDTKGMGSGTVMYQIAVILPDGRVEVIKGSTGEQISHGL